MNVIAPRPKAVSLFSGVGGLDLGVERAGFEVVFQCEADPYRRRVLKRHWPNVPCASDIRDVARWERPRDGAGRDPALETLRGLRGTVDLFIGGSPCQGLSVAGQRRLLADDRSGLFYEYARVADELVRPGGWLLFENVPGLLSGCSCVGCRDCGELLRLHSRGWGLAGGDARRDPGELRLDLGAVDGDGGEDDLRSDRGGSGCCPCRRCDLARSLLAAHNGTEFAVVRGLLGNLGFHDLAWRVLDSRYFGVPQRRRRVFLLARRARGRRAAEILLEPEGGGGDFEAGKEARPRVAASPSRGSASAGVSAPGRRQEDDENLVGPLLSNKASGWRGDDHEAASGFFQLAGTVRSHMRPGSNAFDLVHLGEPEGGGQGDAVCPPANGGRGQARPGLPGDQGRGDGASADPDGVRAPAGLPRWVDCDPGAATIGRSYGDRGVDVEAQHVLDTQTPSAIACALDPKPDGPRYAACGDAVTTFVPEWICRRLIEKGGLK